MSDSFKPSRHYWTFLRKAEILYKVRHLAPTKRAAFLASQGISVEEAAEWEMRLEQSGVKGLCITRRAPRRIAA